jgi:hypothetical protein
MNGCMSITNVMTRFFQGQNRWNFFLIIQFLDVFHYIILQIYHCILFINKTQSM